MQFLTPIFGGLLGVGISSLVRSKSNKAPQALPGATRDDAAAQASATDPLLRRKGGAADILTGIRGAEAPTGGFKTALGQ